MRQPSFHRSSAPWAIVALTIASLWGAGAAGAADWPRFRGPDLDGISRETGLLTAWPEGGPKELWRVPLGAGYAGMAIAGGRLYTQFASGGLEVVGAFDAASGRPLWKVTLEPEYRDGQGDGSRSTPTVDGDTVYALGPQGTFVALGAKDGAPRWKVDLRTRFAARVPQWGISTSPLVEGALVLVDAGGRPGSSVVALHKENGRTAWTAASDKAGYSSGVPLEARGVRQLLFFTGTQLVSLAPADGTLLWKKPWRTDWDVNAAMPIPIPPDKVFVSSGYDTGAALLEVRGEPGALEVEEVWRNREMKNRFSTSVRLGDTIYGFDEKTFKAIDWRSGETRWQSRGLGHGSLIAAQGQLWVLGERCKLVLAEATPEAYREKGSTQILEGKCWTAPALSEGRLFLRNEHELVALDVSG